MQLSSGGATSATSVPEALEHAATAFGHRPAISLLLPSGRQEQSFASVAQWAAKTAHWLQLDHAADDDTTVGVVGPPGWVPAVAALGAWWLGLRVVVGDVAAGADVVVAGPGSDGAVTVRWGYGFDGADAGADGDMFTWVVQEFPDHPPPPRGDATSAAIDQGAVVRSQHDLLEHWHGASGTAGVDGVAAWLDVAALRPLVAGRPTVLLGPGTTRAAADGDRVAAWV